MGDYKSLRDLVASKTMQRVDPWWRILKEYLIWQIFGGSRAGALELVFHNGARLKVLLWLVRLRRGALI